MFACRLGSEHCLPNNRVQRSGPSVHTGSRLPRLAAGVRRFPSDHRSQRCLVESRSPSCDSRHAYPALLRLTLRCLTCHGGMGVLLGCCFFSFSFLKSFFFLFIMEEAALLGLLLYYFGRFTKKNNFFSSFPFIFPFPSVAIGSSFFSHSF